ncbi:MAG: carboxypeptidase-like regulatory domain-containing protein [Planctomycetaceae bacterium]|nr:carboxypeptidase regulatory-like domain-containing protein [Planctomycetaceae bacterium]
MSHVFRFRLSLTFLGLCLLSGCSGGDTREYGSLTGHVSLNGQPAPQGTIISLLNSTTGAASSAQVLAGGEYKIPRIQVGTYQVGFSSQGQSGAQQPTDPDQIMKAIADGQYKAPEPSKEIPEKLRSPEGSGVSVEVKLGENSHDFNL